MDFEVIKLPVYKNSSVYNMYKKIYLLKTFEFTQNSGNDKKMML